MNLMYRKPVGSSWEKKYIKFKDKHRLALNERGFNRRLSGRFLSPLVTETMEDEETTASYAYGVEFIVVDRSIGIQGEYNTGKNSDTTSYVISYPKFPTEEVKISLDENEECYLVFIEKR